MHSLERMPLLINRRKFLELSSRTAAALSLGPLATVANRSFAQSAPSNFTEIRAGVGTFVGQGGTIGWYVKEDTAVVVDSQFPRTAEVCRKGLERRTEGKIQLLLNTHHHGDHTGGNNVFKGLVEKIVAQANVPTLQEAQAKERGRSAGQVYADTTFEKSWKTGIGDEVVKAKHYGPAHTGGDSVIHFQNANVAHVGDLVFNRWHPFIDPNGGGSIKGWASVLEKIHEDFDDETVFIFGRGRKESGITGKRADVLAMPDYFHRVFAFIERAKKDGLSDEDIMNSTPKGFEDIESPSERMSLQVTLQRVLEQGQEKSQEEDNSKGSDSA